MSRLFDLLLLVVTCVALGAAMASSTSGAGNRPGHFLFLLSIMGLITGIVFLIVADLKE